jgi:hemerythrin-like domain-containing protein
MADRSLAGKHLVLAHDLLRRALAELHEQLTRVEAGVGNAAAVRSQLAAMTPGRHGGALSAYCESYCRVLTLHHTREDAVIFPHLRRAEPALAAALDRLGREHLAVHGLIDRLDAALTAFLTGAGAITAVRAAFELLAESVHAHFGYEEGVLAGPLARHGNGSG